jgi:hypothetical protein
MVQNTPHKINYKMPKNILFFLLFLHLNTAFAQVYEGKIGDKYPIVIAISESKDEDENQEFSGTYFYKKERFDIPLKGKKQGNTLRLELNYSGFVTKKVDDETFILEKKLDCWEGKWIHKKQTLGVKLVNAVRSNPEKHPLYRLDMIKSMYETDLYNFIRFENMTFTDDKTEIFMQTPIVWHTEPKSKGRFFSIKPKNTADTSVQKTNDVLLEFFLLNNTWFWSFDCNESSGNDDNFASNITPEFLSAELVSASYWADIYCGGAHPNTQRSFMNYDRKRNKILHITDLLSVDKAPPLYSEENSEKYDNYLEKKLRPLIFTLIKKELKDMQEECLELAKDQTNWYLETFYLSENGFVFHASFPHVARACDDGVTVPYKNLKPYYTPQYANSKPFVGK